MVYFEQKSFLEAVLAKKRNFLGVFAKTPKNDVFWPKQAPKVIVLENRPSSARFKCYYATFLFKTLFDETNLKF